MIKTICKGMLVGALVTLIWSSVNSIWLDEMLSSSILPEEKEAEVLQRLQDVMPPVGNAYSVPRPSRILEKITDDTGSPVVILFNSHTSRAAIYVFILLSSLLPAAFLTWVLCLASKHGFNRRRQHVLLAAVVGALLPSIEAHYVLLYGFPLKWVVIEILQTTVHFALMGLAISLLLRQSFVPWTDMPLEDEPS